MCTRRYLTVLTVTILITASMTSARPQTPANPVSTAALSAPVPSDPELSTGKFPNGMTYYVRANKKPEKRAELRLVVKAGSVLEDDDQRGLAHVVEHMAFEGTAHFPKKDIESFIQSIGMRFGSDLNASTGYDQTIYMLRMPTDNLETLDKALLILEDWAHNVSFDNAAIDLERGIVMEEWRLRRGAGARQSEKVDAILLKGSKYADRLPIGTPEVIQGFKPERLKKFYTDWYRPDLMAVMAVGDFDKAAVEKMVRSHFAGIPMPPSPRPKPNFEVPDHRGTVYAIATDKEETSTTVEIDNLLPGRPQGSISAYRQSVVEDLFSDMIDSRFDEMTQKPNPPFVFAFAGRGGFLGRSCATCPVKEEASLFAEVKDDEIERGLQALLAESDRVSRFGFTATELDREKQGLLRNRERQATEDINRPSASRVGQYTANFINNVPLPTAATDYALSQRFLPEIKLNEINKLAKEWFTDNNRFVTVTAPEKNGLKVPDEKTLTAAIKNTPTKDLTAYVDSVRDSALMDSLPAPGSIVKTSSRESLGITEWELSNGVKVLLKPTTFQEDQIVFRAISPGGTSLASDAGYIPASTATQLVTAGGLGKFNAIDLRKVLTGKLASVSPFINELQEGLTGSSSRKDLETMFQLIYLQFTAPRADPTAVGVFAQQTKTELANQAASPDYAFSEALTTARYQNHLRRRMTTVETVNQWNLDKSMAFYKDRFADASDFAFVFVGNLDLAAIKPLVERYVASLPATHRKETWKDIGVHQPTGIVEKKVERGVEPRGRTTIVFTGPYDWNGQQSLLVMQLMSEVLQRRLLETIREELGGAYTISTAQSTQKFPSPEYSFTIQFGHDPRRADELTRRIFEEIEMFKTQGPTAQQLADAKEARIKQFETNSRQNGTWMNQITMQLWESFDLATYIQIPEAVRKIDAAAIQQMARKYLDPNRYVKVTLGPEQK